VALVGIDLHGSLLAVGAVGIVAVGYALGPFILSRHLSDQPELGVVAASLLVSAAVYLPFGIAQAPAGMPSGPVIAAVVTLGVVCTALAFVLFFRLIAEVGPARATVITYVNPAVALVLGVVVLGESFTVVTAIGFALILVGSVLGTGRDRRAAETPVCAEP
jgi:drug/metabolite transporter (DMT)-like permease